MKRILTILLALLGAIPIKAQVFKVDTVSYNGDISKYLNIVIMGDGYTTTQQNTFRTDADSLIGYLFRQAPWSNYKDYFNVFAIKVISAQSGIRHPNTAPDCSSMPVPVSNPTTYLGCTFDAGGIHRLVVPQNLTNVAAVLSANFPAYDQVFVIANTTYYGGSGGTYATATSGAGSREVTAHEIGHSFAGLADEYYAGDGYASEKPNMTRQSNPALVKWKNWIGANGVGVNMHCCGGNSASWYKPHTNCKMELLGAAYCSVCAQEIVESIHARTNPVVSYLPAASPVSSPQQFISFNLAKLMKPLPNTLKIVWKLDGNVISANTDSVKLNQHTLSNGAHTLTVSVTDTSSLLRIGNHATIHVSTVTWTINKSPTGIALTPAEHEIGYAVYPNPAGKILNISLELKTRSDVSIDIISADGKMIRRIWDKQLAPGAHLNSIDIEALAPGSYFVSIKAGSYTDTRQWIKQ